MSRTFNAFEKATIKNSAKAVAHYLAQNAKLQDKITELQKQQEENLKLIEQYAEPVRSLTGYEPLDLCEKVARGTSQNDWVFKYPTTIVPPQPENNPDGALTQTASAEAAQEATQEAATTEEQPSDRQEDTTAAQPAEEETHYEPEPPVEEEDNRDPMDDFNF